MQQLRQTRSIARLLLAWFALFLLVATVSPIARPQPLEVICSGAGQIQLVAHDDGAAPGSTGHGMDCPLCLLPGAPPPSSPVVDLLPAPVRGAIGLPVSHRSPALALPPLPPRGPPFQPAIA